jgi:hypothetical protein
MFNYLTKRALEPEAKGHCLTYASWSGAALMNAQVC